MEREPRALIGVVRSSRYGLLLATLAAIVVLAPPIADATHGPLFIGVIFVALILACAVAVSHRRVTQRRMLALALVVILADTSLALDPAKPLVLAVGGLRSAFLAFATAAILVHVVRAERVTHDTILGGICVYLLLGLLFHSLFGMVEVIEPGSFRRGDVAVSEFANADRAHGRYPALVYYSFVTLSTVGYGDITPTWSLPQSLSAAEAVVGQLYLAILVASLVGMRLATQQSGAGGR